MVDQNRCVPLLRALRRVPSRRDVFHGLAATGLGLGMARLPGSVEAKKKHKRKHKVKKAKPNAFGCLDVGDPCQNADQCCSGICEGKKGQKHCQAHDTGPCDQEVAGFCESAGPTQTRCENRPECFCLQTTGESTICGTTLEPSACADCRKDADCEAQGFPAGSSCVPFSEGNCAGLCETGMACVAPCGATPPES
jgi:hypothetical protein